MRGFQRLARATLRARYGTEQSSQRGRDASTRLGCLLALALGVGCDPGGVGDPCIPEDEYRAEFSGYSKDEVNVESRSFQCETRLCLVNKFQGRVSCPYGQGAQAGSCRTPDGAASVQVPVVAQLVARSPEDAVYCSCRCAGPDRVAPYCECPSGFECADLIPNVDLGDRQLAGSYCVKAGTERESDEFSSQLCDATSGGCTR